MDMADLDAVGAAVETESAAEAMEHDGVLPEALVMLVEAYSSPILLPGSAPEPDRRRRSTPLAGGSGDIPELWRR
jgi:hypothetical protein